MFTGHKGEVTQLSTFIRELSLLAISLTYSASCFASHVWDVDTIYRNSSNQNSAILTAEEKTVTTIDTSQIEMLMKVSNDIASQSGTYAKLLLSDEPLLNAWAQSANGANTVTITFSMLMLIGNDSDKCAALLGHEYTHLKLNHSAQKETVDTVLTILSSLAGGVIDAVILNKTGVTLSIGRDTTEVVGQGLNAAYSRTEEREADAYGTRWMMQAGYNPQGSIRLQEVLLQQNGDNNSFLATHPPSSERVANIKKIISEFDPSKNVTLTTNRLPNSASEPVPISAPDTPIKSLTNISGQVGVVLKVKYKYNYFIFAGTTSTRLPVGAKVYVLSANNEKVPALIERAVDGYYSATYEDSVTTFSRGERVLIEGDKQ